MYVCVKSNTALFSPRWAAADGRKRSRCQWWKHTADECHSATGTHLMLHKPSCKHTDGINFDSYHSWTCLLKFFSQLTCTAFWVSHNDILCAAFVQLTLSISLIWFARITLHKFTILLISLLFLYFIFSHFIYSPVYSCIWLLTFYCILLFLQSQFSYCIFALDIFYFLFWFGLFINRNSLFLLHFCSWHLYF